MSDSEQSISKAIEEELFAYLLNEDWKNQNLPKPVKARDLKNGNKLTQTAQVYMGEFFICGDQLITTILKPDGTKHEIIKYDNGDVSYFRLNGNNMHIVDDKHPSMIIVEGNCIQMYLDPKKPPIEKIRKTSASKLHHV